MQRFLADHYNDRPVIILTFLALFACTHLTRYILHQFDPHAHIPSSRTHHLNVLIPFQILKLSVAILILLSYLPTSTPTPSNLSTTPPPLTPSLNPTTHSNIPYLATTTTTTTTTTQQLQTLHNRLNLFTLILHGYIYEIIAVPTLSLLQLTHHICVLIPFAIWLLSKRDDALSVHERELLYAIPTVMVVCGMGGFESVALGVRVLCAFREGEGEGRGGDVGDCGDGGGEDKNNGRACQRQIQTEREKERKRKTNQKTRTYIRILWKIAWQSLLIQWFIVGCLIASGFWEVGRVMGIPEAFGCLGLLVVWARTEWVAVMGVGRLVRKFEEI